MKKGFILLFFMLCGWGANAQKDSSLSAAPTLGFSGFVDVFYVYDVNQPNGNRQPFFFNHNRHNEFNINLGLIQLEVQHPKYRANIGLQTGTYANDNYIAEPGVLKSVFQANVGLSLNAKNNLWVDAGIMPSHLGFESALSIENYTLTRSLVAESSPYFLSGAKLTYNPNQYWEMAVLVVNGWQRIQRVPGSSLPSFGTQVVWRPTKKTTLNWSTFIGTDDPDSTRRMRYFNNVYGQFKLGERWGVITGFDFGLQQKMKGSTNYFLWYAPVVIAQLTLTEKWKTAVRWEYYQDYGQVIIASPSPNGFQTQGISLTLDYLPFKNVAWRVEGRWLNSGDRVFSTPNGAVKDNLFVATSLAIKIE